MSSTLDYFRYHAFTSERFDTGNPAAVFVTAEAESGLTDRVKQQLANESALPMSVFVTRQSKGVFGVDFWSKFGQEPVCGHATLCAAQWAFDEDASLDKIELVTPLAGSFYATKEVDGRVSIDLPARPPLEAETTDEYRQAITAAVLKGASALSSASILQIVKSFRGPIVELGPEVDLKALRPDFSEFHATNDKTMIILTQAAPEGSDSDIRSRAFGVEEDPVCGSAHCAVVPWFLSNAKASSRLRSRKSTSTLVARHDSPRGGYIEATWNQEEGRMKLTGATVKVLRGVVHL